MSEDLVDRLRRLGLSRGARHLRPAKPAEVNDRRGALRPRGAVSLEQYFPGGRLEQSDHGACFVLDHVYPITYFHGSSQIASLLIHEPRLAGAYCGDQRLAQLDFRDFVFLDTETTGLAGAGTLAFMVGIAFFETSGKQEVLVVRQYFLRDHADEAAMLQFLAKILMERGGLITFNGNTFDLNILENRYLINRMRAPLRGLPHIDLLQFARRLWRLRLGSVALGNLERELLEIQRTEEDVPGWQIPTIYNDYLRTQDAREIARVFYHNEIDMLSMVTLTDYLLGLIGQTHAEVDPIDRYSLGKWQADLGLTAEAEQTLSRVVQDENLPLSIYHSALKGFGLLLKRQQRYQEALPLWQQWAATSLDEVDAHVELAKFYEWQERDIPSAEEWTRRALRLIAGWPESRARLIRPELDHRLCRLKRKLADYSE